MRDFFQYTCMYVFLYNAELVILSYECNIRYWDVVWNSPDGGKTGVFEVYGFLYYLFTIDQIKICLM